MLKHFAEDPENMEPSCNFEKIMSTLFTDSGTPREGNGNQLLICFCLWVSVKLSSFPVVVCWTLTTAWSPDLHVAWDAGGLFLHVTQGEGCDISGVFMFWWSLAPVLWRWHSGVLWGEKSIALQCLACLDPSGVLVLRQVSALQQRHTCWCPFRNGSFALWFSSWLHTGWGSLTALDKLGGTEPLCCSQPTGRDKSSFVFLQKLN